MVVNSNMSVLPHLRYKISLSTMDFVQTLINSQFPNNIDECPSSWLTNSTTKAAVAGDDANLLPGYLPIYELSYIWYSALGKFLLICRV